MSSKIVVANFNTGFETDVEPFLLDNTAFPTLINFYLWRGRARRKRGTFLLGRFQRSIVAQALGNTDGAGSFTGNLISIFSLPVQSPDAQIVPGTIDITVGASPQHITDTGGVGNLYRNNILIGTINYSTGAITFVTTALQALTITFGYYPVLPVMGLEDREVDRVNFPVLVGFDTRWSYEYDSSTRLWHDTTFYKNTGTPFTFHNQDYQQFWSTNYQGAMWVTNNTPGNHFLTVTSVIAAGPLSNVTTSVNHNLKTGDIVWFNEMIPLPNGDDINGQSFTITVTGANTFTIPLAVSAGLSGILQTLTGDGTNNTGDGIKWYDGDFTVVPTTGWVNFAPPLSQFTAANPQPEYLLGCKIIFPFKDRLLCFGVWTANSSNLGNPVYYQNRLIYSQNGTVYYTNPVPNPNPPQPTQVVDLPAWYFKTGRGGRLTAPIWEEIITLVDNEDVLLAGYETQPLKLVYTGDDILPFYYQTVSSELGSQSTFSGISMDAGSFTIGDYGIALTTQQSAQRIDLKIPDQIFDIADDNNASQRVTAIRDFRNEFIYFTYPSKGNDTIKFPNTTLLYNYRENNWALLEESYTTYGTYRRPSNFTWSNVPYDTWSTWTTQWDFGGEGERYPNIIGGNQQGFVLMKDVGVTEDNSLGIKDFDTTLFQITSPNHGLRENDFIQINNVLGVSNVNGATFLVQIISTSVIQLLLDDEQVLTPPSGVYGGNGVFKRLIRPTLQTKQFQAAWDQGRQTRFGSVRYLLDNTDDGAITATVFADQDTGRQINNAIINPYLIFTDIVLTSPEQPGQIAQDRIWHRQSNSFNGETIQLGITLSDAQMKNNDVQESEITLHALVIDIYPGPVIA